MSNTYCLFLKIPKILKIALWHFCTQNCMKGVPQPTPTPSYMNQVNIQAYKKESKTLLQRMTPLNCSHKCAQFTPCRLVRRLSRSVAFLPQCCLFDEMNNQANIVDSNLFHKSTVGSYATTEKTQFLLKFSLKSK